MFLITGLGNPGIEYENTPHNAGFIFLDTLREYLEKNTSYQIGEWENESKLFKSYICKVRKGGEVVGMLQKPVTYMNRSGEAVRDIFDKFEIEKFVLAHDDLDIKLGNTKIQVGKSPKGHRGVLSVEESIKDTEFLRVRIGIENRENPNIPGEEYVLQKFSPSELELLRQSIDSSLQEVVSKLNI